MRRFAFALLALAACMVPDKRPLEVGSDDDGATVDAMPPDGPGDSAAPETTITAAPGEFTNHKASVFEFVADEEDVIFECSIDAEPPATCASPFTRALDDGPHTFSVRAVDAAGNGDDTPAEHLWTIDTVAPNTTLTEAPPAADNSTIVHFAFEASEKNVTFDCALDGAEFATCESGGDVGPVGDGAHSFAVRAHDRAGNVDASPAIYAWSVDTSTPDTQILTGPSGSSGETSASFTFVSPDAGSGATFECALDSASFTACTSPRNLTGLSEAEHTFRVRVKDAVGNYDPTPATRTWTVDLSAPDTSITSGPEGSVPIASASFAFTSSEAGASFQCALDGAAWAACTSPQSFTGLAQGQHTFAVRARDVAGHDDPSPATRTWTVDTVAPDVMFTSGPAQSGTSGPRVIFGFTVSEGTTSCSLDNGAFVACTSPYAFNAPAGAHALRVRATDAAGNAATAIRAWTVQCAAPGVTGAAGLLHLDDASQMLANATGGASALLGDDETVEAADPAALASARFAGGLSFDAAESDHVSWPAALGTAGDLAFELWARPDAANGDVLVADGLALRVSATDGQVRFGFALGDDGVSSAAVTAGAWHHVVVSVDAPMMALWVDGVRTDASVTIETAPVLDALRLGGGGFSGALDEVWLSLTAIATDENALERYCPL
jgi:hypothetical protein